ncbi:ABC transporter transmembrane domain-containing protein [Donghicola sp. XS_ASV15]|uniref:ABC transporter transmembrane domain-containing protein n=1 Tax=Donghicola sp. XS_ASV15 TaxID=3241295 RepID=UPI003517E945
MFRFPASHAFRRSQVKSKMFEYYRLIWGLLDAHERRRFLSLIGLSIGMAVAEMSGVAAIFPFLALAGDPDAMGRGAIFPRLSDWTGITEPERFTALIGAGVLLLLLSGMGLRAVGTYAQTRFAMMRGRAISRRLLQRHLRRPYIWHLQQKGSDLSQSLLSEVDLVVQQAILPAIMLLTNISVSLLIVTLLFLANPIVAAAATGLLVAVYGAVLLILRHPLQRAGAKRVAFNKERFHQVGEIGGAIKELKATGQEQRAVDAFRRPAKGMAQAHTSAIVLGQIPKFALEAVIYGGFVSLLLIGFASGSSALADIMPLLGLFGMASLKLFPALQQVFADISLLRFSRDALVRLHKQLRDPVNGGVKFGHCGGAKVGQFGASALERAALI